MGPLGMWKELEGLMLDTSFGLVYILIQLRILNYKNFCGLRLNKANILEEQLLDSILARWYVY